MESEPTPSPEVPAEPEPLPDREDVIFDVLAVCIAIGLVLLAIAVRANMKRERLRNMAKKKGSAEVRERVAPAQSGSVASRMISGARAARRAAPRTRARVHARTRHVPCPRPQPGCDCDVTASLSLTSSGVLGADVAAGGRHARAAALPH